MNQFKRTSLRAIKSTLVMWVVAVPAVGRAQSPCPDVTDPAALNSYAGSDESLDQLPQVASDSGNVFVAVWSSNEDLGGIGTDRDILFARSADNGANWSAAAPLYAGAASDDGRDENPSIATNGAGLWIVVWNSDDNLNGIGSDDDILYSRSIDNGQTWSEPVPIDINADADSGDDLAPRLATDGSGNWVIVWASDEDLDGIGTDFDILVSRSDNNGATWSAAAPLDVNAAINTGTDSVPQVTTDGAGRWVAVWESNDVLDGIGTDEDILFSVSDDNGESWLPPQALEYAYTDAGTDDSPQLTVNPSGMWVMVWQSQNDIDGSGIDPDILFSVSPNGTTWAPPHPLNTNATNDGNDYGPYITTSANGSLVTVWNSATNLDGIGADFDILYSLSLNNAATWSPPQALNTTASIDGSSDFDFTPHLAAGAGQNWVAVWRSTYDLEGQIGNDSDILTARLQFTENDCNGNSIPDECEDCNGNGIADECDIENCPPEDPTCQDCNGNSFPDECDIDPGDPDGNGEVSDDCQPDAIPDECQKTGDVQSTWVDGAGLWNVAENWCPDVVPNNNTDNDVITVFSVTLGGASEVTLDTSPTIQDLSMTDGASVEVNDNSGANVRTLAVDFGIASAGEFRATDRERLVLDTPVLDQTGVCADCADCSGVGILEATDGLEGTGEADDLSILEINNAMIIGGIAQTFGTHSEIHLIGGAELIDVCVSGVVVPDGQTGGFGGTLFNNDVLTIQGISSDTYLGPTTAGAMLMGSGSVRLSSQAYSHLGDFKTAFTNALDHRIEGAGIIFGSLTNDGTIEANHGSGEHLIVFPPGTKTGNGLLAATGGGVLRIEDGITGSGAVVAAGGTITLRADVTAGSCTIGSVPPDMAAASILNVSHAGLTVNGPVVIGMGGAYQVDPETVGQATATLTSGTLSLLGGPNGSFSGFMELGGAMQVETIGNLELQSNDDDDTTPPDYIVLDAAQCVVGGDLVLAGNVLLNYGASVPMMLNGNFDHQGTWPANFDWLGGALQMNGDATLEAAGEDRGADPSGYEDNFAFGELILAAGATVQVVDVFDNQEDGLSECDEALYVSTLVVNTGATLLTDGCRVYYNELQGGGSIPSLGIDVIQIGSSCPADMGGDGMINAADLALLLGGWGPCAGPCTPDDGLPNAGCPADLNDDCSVNAADLAVMLGSWGPCR